MAKWSVTVCENNTNVQRIVLQGGPGRNDNDVFATWTRGGGKSNFDFPARTENLAKVYFQANTSTDGDAEMCVKYSNNPKKRVHMTKAGNENHDIESSDTENDCKC